jgi:hypothetical protein
MWWARTMPYWLCCVCLLPIHFLIAGYTNFNEDSTTIHPSRMSNSFPIPRLKASLRSTSCTAFCLLRGGEEQGYVRPGKDKFHFLHEWFNYTPEEDSDDAGLLPIVASFLCIRPRFLNQWERARNSGHRHVSNEDVCVLSSKCWYNWTILLLDACAEVSLPFHHGKHEEGNAFKFGADDLPLWNSSSSTSLSDSDFLVAWNYSRYAIERRERGKESWVEVTLYRKIH